MCFYGALGLLFGFYLWFTIFWKVGNGFNEFNKNSGVVRIFRWGLPGKNRRIDFRYKIQEIEGLRVELKEGVNPRRAISLQVKGKGDIPLTRIGIPIALEDIESEASELAQFLQISLETFYQV
uniref:photosystem I assembly protein Ycf4 n=1 Tax=Kalinella pachyderma TaxID=2704665 RepID=UPI0024113A7C|nr:photosystem I assembly protein Ycf4 [Kalinella pachyderma]WDY12868.1 photosystem I assembly protein Ycf4 [Kalinella pachyderma]